MQQENRLCLDGVSFYPAIIEGNADVFINTSFIMAKKSWQPDGEALNCPLCLSKFGGIKRRHHCRQCGLVVCNKCCYEKIPLPQLGLEEPEKVCEYCRPITAAVTRSRSHLPDMQLKAIAELAEICKDNRQISKIFQFGGFHTLLAHARIQMDLQNMDILWRITGALHNLSTCEPVLDYMVKAGVLKVLCHSSCRLEQDIRSSILRLNFSSCSVIQTVSHTEFPSGSFIEAGCLLVILELCNNPSDTVVMMTISTLSILVESPLTHKWIIEGDKQVLQRLLQLTAAPNPPMQAVALKCLNYLAMSSDWNKHRILQEDFTAGRPLKTTLETETFNIHVSVNAACLIANLATSAEDQKSLADCRNTLITLLKSDIANLDLLCHVIRGLANFAKFSENAARLSIVIPLLVSKYLKHSCPLVKKHALRILMYLLTNDTGPTITELLINGAGEVFQNLVEMPDLLSACFSVLQKHCPEIAKPL